MKQVIMVRQDLKLPKGKLAAQVAHAAVEAVLRSEKDIVKKWRAEGMMKIVVKVKDEKELYRYKGLADELGITNAVITDAGKTVVAPGTVTCMAIGPDEEELVDKVSGKLKIL